MATVVEDGTGVLTANSYASDAQLTAYALERGITLTGEPSELLTKAMDYYDTLTFIGLKSTKDQPLQWPRTSVWIDGFSYASTELPQELIDGQMATSLAIDAGFDPLSTIERAIKKDKTGPLETEWMDNASSAEIIRSITSAVRKLVTGNSGGINFNVRVG